MSDFPRVLVVDDEFSARKTLENLLYNQGYELHFAESGAQALSDALEWQPDAILCDVNMPGMDGFELCRRIRATPPIASVPLIFITALDDPKSKLAGLDAGADDLITKPLSAIELRARLRTITKLNRYRLLNDQRLGLEQAHQKLLAAYDATLQAYDATIEGWSRALDLRDRETEGHTQRVTELTVSLACVAGLTTEELRHIRWGALLHDIGKMGVSDQILHKPGPLTPEEWIIMRQHPVHAYNMLVPIDFLRKAIEIPYGHHEKWDGTGYPRGLQGEDIPFAARLFAVVDIWDALTSERPYRTAMPPAQVLEYIRSLRGNHLDPQVVDLFFKLPSK